MAQYEIYSEPVFNNGVTAITRYACINHGYLVAHMAARVAAIDVMRSPTASEVWQRPDGLWVSDLTYRGVD